MRELARRALEEVMGVDGLAEAKARYDEAVMQARTAGWTWSEMARVLGVSKQALHSRFRDRAPG